MYVLKLLKSFSKEKTEEEFVKSGLKAFFSNEENSGKLSGFIIKTGILGMLEASEYKLTWPVSLFSRETAVSYCGNASSALVAKVFTRYVDIINCMFERSDRPGWKNQEVFDLKFEINILIDMKKSGFWFFSRISCVKI